LSLLLPEEPKHPSPSHPDVDEEEIRGLAINACATVSKNVEVQPKITRVVGEAFWKSWIVGG
jgi:hypothetical protein